MSRYRIAVNLELTSKCNARCVMCPREAIPEQRQMTPAILDAVLARLKPEDVFRVVLAGYGEPTTHPRFDEFVPRLTDHPVQFDMVSNGQLLDERRLRLLDGAIGTLIISFSSIVPAVYDAVHVNLDQVRVMENIALAQRTLRQTTLAISLTPLSECLDTLPETIAWLRGNGVGNLTMSPTLYDRAGTLNGDRADGQGSSHRDLRAVIRQYGLHSQEMDFVPSLRDVLAQHLANRFKCTPRNIDVLISAQGQYMYCFNDIGHRRPLASVHDLSLRQAIALREETGADPEICGDCNIQSRYGIAELAGAAIAYLRPH
ncbi:MAG: radical SAM protein [Rhodospirillaceae bacterium]|nr:radical SAM protein [Rhodospirillaceae bacterium]MBT4169693.1 radical SAM protein [Rhodospirillaceae bacterium]MBT5128846.1 radical SAM protein [Rhodospirillaceae bacterium]MBT6676454.1 radical SAM protein [Rhodospirillaceae bacterium]MBT7159261.1 radical SAM protein [Rhodospirillaceae bacterium]